jgi:hypothetical protein
MLKPDELRRLAQRSARFERPGRQSDRRWVAARKGDSVVFILHRAFEILKLDYDSISSRP